MHSIINQIKSDYFINVERNINKFGYPWGVCSRKHRKKDMLYQYSKSSDLLVKSFAIFLKTLNPVISRKSDLLSVFKWIKQGRAKELNIFIMICPDYDCYLDTSGRSLKYKFNNILDCGVGLIAEKAIDTVLKFERFARENGINFHYIFGMADYEDSDENLKFFQETSQSFKKKINQSNNILSDKLDRLGFSNKAKIIL